MTKNIDLEFRPTTYFRPQKLEDYLLSKVKGAVLRKKLQALFDEGRHAEVSQLLSTDGISAADRKALESVHPMFMGGNYLPDTEEGEVEIGRISIQSTTYDVTCVYAKPINGEIHYRIVDEYNGETLDAPTEAVSKQPMSLQEFRDFFLKGWPLLDVLEMNFEGDLDGSLDFFTCASDFYPEFDRACRDFVIENFPVADEDEGEPGDTCPICEKFNSTPSGDTCEHLCAWQWDGQLEIVNGASSQESHWTDLVDLVSSREDDSPEDVILKAQEKKSPTRAKLIAAASRGCSLIEVLTDVLDVQSGNGWSTAGMLGGAGFNLYIDDPKKLRELDKECVLLVEACSQISVEVGVSGLEKERPQEPVDWLPVASGLWEEDRYHSGHIAYYIANVSPGNWVMDGVSRNTMLDDVTEEDIEEGRLNDDQIQAMWGQTLEEAQNAEFREIVAKCSGVTSEVSPYEIAKILYRAVCDDGGKEISEFDRSNGLLDGPPVAKPEDNKTQLTSSSAKSKSKRLRAKPGGNARPSDSDSSKSKNAKAEQKGWSKTLNALAEANDPTTQLNQIANEGAVPPVGNVTRLLLLSWIKAKPLSGGKFKTSDVNGFGVSGNHEEPFLSIVLGRDERKLRVLEDIRCNDPESYQSLLSKLKLVADSAKKKRPEIKNMAMPSMGKSMLSALYSYGENLLTGIPSDEA